MVAEAPAGQVLAGCLSVPQRRGPLLDPAAASANASIARSVRRCRWATHGVISSVRSGETWQLRAPCRHEAPQETSEGHCEGRPGHRHPQRRARCRGRDLAGRPVGGMPIPGHRSRLPGDAGVGTLLRRSASRGCGRHGLLRCGPVSVPALPERSSDRVSQNVQVIGVNRPDRAARRRSGKSDEVDAEAAARAVLGGEPPPGRSTPAGPWRTFGCPRPSRTQTLRGPRTLPMHQRLTIARNSDTARLTDHRGINLNTHRAVGMRAYAAAHDWLSIIQLPSCKYRLHRRRTP